MTPWTLRACFQVVTVVALIVGYLPAALSAQATDNRLPPPTGSVGCGRATYAWIDAVREEPWTDAADDRREALVTLWYPARIEDDAKTGPYFPRAECLPGGPKGFDRGVAATLVTHAFDDAPLATCGAPFPVLLFSPGAGATPFYYTTLLEELASHGYVVAAIDHCYEGRGQVFPDGHAFAPDAEKRRPDPKSPDIERQTAEYYRRRVDLRAADAKFVLDQLHELNSSDPRFAGTLDLARVGAFGHSLGGVTATEMCAIDPRFKAAANLDGVASSRPLFLRDNGSAIRQPLLFLAKPVREISAENRKSLGLSDERAAEIFGDMKRRITDALSKVEGGAWYVKIAGATHSSFSDEVYFLPTDATEKRHITRLARAYLVAFFDTTLCDRPVALLGPGSDESSGVIVERFPPHDGDQ
jgi:predicted dienelactone hydrolase